jgi:glycosyltransferase involved in cell wall biosynthesis
MTLSVCIICFNEEHNIRRCLESAAWADEIVVVDSMSQDKTVDVAKAYTDRIYQREWTGYVDQKNYALSKAREGWVLSLDADEEVTGSLREEIRTEMAKSETSNGYRIPRCSFYQGRWIHHSGFYPDRQLRLFRKERGHWVGGRVHERVEVQGRIGELKNDLLHFPYHGSISGQLATVNRFSSLLAEDLYAEGKRCRLALLLARPPFKFLEVYFIKLGFLDGLAGLIIAVTSAYAMFVRYVKLREIEKNLAPIHPEAP